MPKTALRCLVDINVHAVTCPGVWLPRRDDVYLTVTLFNQVRRTNLSSPIFPLLFHERFKFDRVFYTAYEPSQVADSLEDMKILIELIQLSDLYEGGRLLAYYEGNARDFLYPFPSYSPSYGTTDRELLLERSLDFPGISPKLEFSTKTIIQETTSPVLGGTYDDFGVSYKSWSPRMVKTPRRSRSRSRKRSTSRSQRYQRPTVSSISRSRSVSPCNLSRSMSALELEDEPLTFDDVRPPFVVRKVKKDLIGRIPGSRSPMRTSTLSSGKRKERRFNSSLGSHMDDYVYTYNNTPRRYQSSQLHEDYSRYSAYSDPESSDSEIAGLMMSDYHKTPRYYSPQSRSTSPILYRSTLRDRYDERPWSPTRSELIRDRIDNVLRRNRSLERLDRLGPSYASSRDSDLDSLDRLAVDFERAKVRSMDPDQHIIDYWRLQNAKVAGKNHRDNFNSALNEVYADLYQKLKEQRL